jgi:hypothetical protein
MDRFGVGKAMGEVRTATGDRRPKEGGKGRVAVAEHACIGTRPIDGSVERCLQAAGKPPSTFHQVDDEQVGGAERQAAGVPWLDENPVGARDAGADMTAVVHDLLHDEQARALGHLFAEIFDRFVWHGVLASLK